MTAPARLTLSKEELWQAKLLAKGQTEWEELDYETKKMLYNTGINLSYRVDDEQMSRFERKMALRGEEGVIGAGRAIAAMASDKVLK